MLRNNGCLSLIQACPEYLQCFVKLSTGLPVPCMCNGPQYGDLQHCARLSCVCPDCSDAECYSADLLQAIVEVHAKLVEQLQGAMRSSCTGRCWPNL